MSKTLTKFQIQTLALEYNIPYDNLRKVLAVESGGYGFDKKTGKIIIQFEPSWFKRLFPRWRNDAGIWAKNAVERQPQEWIAFNDAFRVNPIAAMQSASIGILQVMGFWWKKLGFNSVGHMWDFAKESEANQLKLGLMVMKSNPKMYKAIQNSDWETFAYYYNGAQWRKFNYAERLRKA